MRFLSWLRDQTPGLAPSRGGRTPRRNPVAPRLQVERLEDRCLLSVTEAFVIGDYFGYNIPGVPDIDQRRETVDPFIVGLPNDGAMYCFPTATMNWGAYIDHHG